MIIRGIESNDALSFLAMLKQLDSEQKFMMYEPNERKTTADEMCTYIMEMKSSGSLIIVAEENDKIAGFLTAERGFAKRIKHSAYIIIGVLKEYTGQGVGTKLFKELLKWTADNGIVRLELTVMCHNEKALALYKKMGFKIEGIKKNSLLIDNHYVDEYYMARVDSIETTAADKFS